MPFRTLGMEVPEDVLPPNEVDPEGIYNQQFRPQGRMFKDIPNPHDADPRVQYPGMPWEGQDQLRGPVWANPDKWMGSEYKREQYNNPQQISAEGGADEPDTTGAPDEPDVPDAGSGYGTKSGRPLAPFLQPAQPAEGQTKSGRPLAPFLQPATPAEEPPLGGLTPEDVQAKDIPKSLAERAAEEDIGPNGVDAGVRFMASLAWGAGGNSPQENIGNVQKAMEFDEQAAAERVGREPRRVEVAYNEKLGELIYRYEGGDGQWQLFRGAGPISIHKDIAAAMPELGVMTAEVGGGVAGSRAGIPGMSLGSGVAGGMAEWARLKLAQKRGFDITDDQIIERGIERAIWTAGGTVALGYLLRGLSVAYRLWSGEPLEVRAVFKKYQDLVEGKPLADRLNSEVRTITAGEPTGPSEFPMTAGQQAGAKATLGSEPGRPAPIGDAAEGALSAEGAIVKRGEAGQPVRDVMREQAQVMNDVDFAIFGSRDPQPKTTAGRVLRRAMNAAIAAKPEKLEQGLPPGEELTARAMGRTPKPAIRPSKTSLEEGKTRAEQAIEAPVKDAAGKIIPPETSLQTGRDLIQEAKGRLQDAFDAAYAGMERNSRATIDLAPVRDAALSLEKKFGQKIITELNPALMHKELFDQMKNAGLSDEIVNGVRQQMSGPASLADLEKVRRGLNLELRKVAEGSAEGNPQKALLLRTLRDGIDDAIDKGVPPEVLARIHSLRSAYSDMVEKFDNGVVGELLGKDRFGNFNISGQKAVDYILADPRNAKQFVESVRGSQFFDPKTGKLQPTFMPEMGQALIKMQQGILAHTTQRFKDFATQKWDTQGLKKFIQEHKESLDEIFGIKNAPDFSGIVKDPANIFTRGLKSITDLTAQLERNEGAKKAAVDLFKRRFGVFTADPAELVSTLLNDGRVQDLKLASRLVQRFGPEAKRDFDRGLAQAARDKLSNGKGQLDPAKFDEFMTSEYGKTIMATLDAGRVEGARFSDHLRTLGDMLKIRDMQATGVGPQDLAEKMGRSVPALQHLARFMRVIAPPLSARGRALTGALGLMNEKTQIAVGKLLADPKKMGDFINLAKKPISPESEAFSLQMKRLGLTHWKDAWEMIKSADAEFTDKLIDPKNGTFDEREGRAQFDGMGKPVPIPEAPLKFKDRPDGTQGPMRMEQGGGTMTTTPADAVGPDGAPIQGLPQRSPSAITPLRLDEGSGLTGMPGETTVGKSQNIPGSFSGAMEQLTPHFQTNFGDENYTGNQDFKNSEMRANEKGWLTPEQQQQTIVPKGMNGVGNPSMRLDGVRPEVEQLAKEWAPFQDRREPLDREELDKVMRFQKKFFSLPEAEQEQVKQLLRQQKQDKKPMYLDDGGQEQRPGSALEAGNQGAQDIVKGIGKFTKATAEHFMDLLEKAQSPDPEVQHRAATELALLVTGVGGSRRALTVKGGTELGSAGGGLPPIKPPARATSAEEVRGRISTVEGGPEVVKKHVDELSIKLSDALKAAHEAVQTGKGDIPSSVKFVRKHITALEKEAEGLMHEANQLGPPLTPYTKWQLRKQGRDPATYKLELLDEINHEIDMGKREAFRLMSTGRDVKKPVTLENVQEWLDAAGVKAREKNMKGGDTRYLEVMDPASPGNRFNIRFPTDEAAHLSVQPGVAGMDTGKTVIKPPSTRGEFSPRHQELMKGRAENVSGESFSEWQNLIEALKFRLTKSPDGQWLISEDKKPRFPRKVTRDPAEGRRKQEEQIMRDRAEARGRPIKERPEPGPGPQQLEFDFRGDTPFEGLVK